jgi:O-antigen/teichoic acid export membrane protein
VASGAIVLLCTLVLLRREAGIKPRFEWRVWRGVMHKVLPYALAAAVGVIYFRLAIVLMGYVASAQATGVYAAAFRIVETLSVVPWLVASSGFPILVRAARDDLERLRYGMQRLFDVSLLFGSWIALSVAVGAPFAIAVIAGRPQFDASIPVLRLQALSLVTSFLVAVWSFALLALGKYRMLLIANALATVASAVLTIVLVPAAGAKGGALATFGAEAVLAVGYLVAVARYHRSLIPRLGVGGRLLPGLVVAIACAVFVPLPAVVMVVLVSIVFWASAWLCGAVPNELIAAARRGRLDSAL